jgi:hypothetical protein
MKRKTAMDRGAAEVKHEFTSVIPFADLRFEGFISCAIFIEH